MATDPSEDRILWNVRGEDIDEVVLSGVNVHIEQMNDRCWWIGIYRGDTCWMGNFVTDSQGCMRFVEQENDGIEWARDEEHERLSTQPEEQT